jgi:small subunit ribosomal protein S6
LREYETTFVLDAGLEEEALTRQIQRVEETITTGGGEVTKVERWGIKRFAYLLKKRRQGYYVHIRFSAPRGVPRELESFYKLSEEVLRYLTVLAQPLKERPALTPEAPVREGVKDQAVRPDKGGETPTSLPEVPQP